MEAVLILGGILRQLTMFFASTAFLAAVTLSTASGACMAGECFRGKTISLIVGFGAGGGYDAYARLIAPELEQATGATVVVRNRPGAGGLIALNEISQAPNDGTILGVVNITSAVVAQGLGNEAVRFDIGKFAWLAGIGAEQRVLLIPALSDVLPWKQHQGNIKPFRWAAGGPTDDMAINASLLSESLGLNARIITGYKGTNEAVLGVIRGEADAVVISADSARSYADSRAIQVAAVVSSARSTLFPDAPTIFDVIDGTQFNPESIHLLTGLSALGRGIAAVPGTPKDTIEYLRTTIRGILSDEDFLRRSKLVGRNINYRPPQELETDVASTLASMRTQPELQHVLREKHF